MADGEADLFVLRVTISVGGLQSVGEYTPLLHYPVQNALIACTDKEKLRRGTGAAFRYFQEMFKAAE
jgi:hypothetical protein